MRRFSARLIYRTFHFHSQLWIAMTVALAKQQELDNEALRLDAISVEVDFSSIHESGLNQLIYHELRGLDELADSIDKHGILTPLKLTRDYYLVDGHRRFNAMKHLRQRLGLKHRAWKMPCQFINKYRSQMTDDEFLKLLQSYNEAQRIKSVDELLREKIISQLDHKDEIVKEVRMKEALRALGSNKESVNVPITGKLKRPKISQAKQEMVNSIIEVVQAQKSFWPLTVRRIHYALLNNPPLRNISRPDSRYKNDDKCYDDLCKLMARMRLSGLLSWAAIADATRPDMKYVGYADPSDFYTESFDNFLDGYQRDLLQSQPNFIQVVAEKNTVQSTIQPICAKYRIPYMIGRGFSCLDIRYKLYSRFMQSQKVQLVLLILSDLDPEGVEIFNSFPRSMRDDFGIDECLIHTVRVAMRPDQVQTYNLPTSMDAKPNSSNYEKFVHKYGTQAYELEAMPPEVLQDELDLEIRKVIDWQAFNAEQQLEDDEIYEIQIQKQTLTEQMLPMLNNP
jgi:hypothetical protein